MNNTTRETVVWADLTDAIRANPNRGVGLPKRVAAPPPTPQTLSWLQGWAEDTTCTVPDVVSFVLWMRDPMYRATTPAGRRTMEMEEAQSLLLTLDESWKAHNGRGRGWVRKHIEEDLRLRAGGGDPAPAFWTDVCEKKRTALLMDYVCILRSLRVAVWWPAVKTVTVYPMLGGQGAVAQLNGDAGRMLIGPAGFTAPAAECAALLKRGIGIEWAPPASISATQTMSELATELSLYGISAVGIKNKASLWLSLQWQRFLASLNGAVTTSAAGIYADDEATQA
jgi:hypothetical protein